MTEVVGAFDRINKFFEKIFKDKTNEFYSMLKKSEALVSGGCVTKSLFETTEDWYGSDVDIYVNSKNVLPLRDWLISQCEKIVPKARASLYCNSFLKRNNVIKVQSLTVNGYSFDLMHVRNKSNPVNVVKNFDLTCCQNYFDGEKVMCLFPELTLQKKTLLNPEYGECLINGNPFTRSRIQKYMARGFNLSLNMNILAKDFKPYQDTSFLGLSLDTDNSSDMEKLLKEFVRLTYYYTFFGINQKMHSMYKYEVTELIKSLCKTELSFKNKIGYCPCYHNYSEFYDDGFDSDDFNKLNDYGNVSKDKAIQVYIELLNLIRENEINPFISKNKEKILEHFEMFKGDFVIDSTNKIEIFDSKYPNLKDKTCYVETVYDDVKVSEFMTDNSNILIKYNDTLKGYNRKKLLDFFLQKIELESKIETTRLYSGESILYSDSQKLKIDTIQVYLLINSGMKINDKCVYSLVPTSLENI